jgi:hypothetical protein
MPEIKHSFTGGKMNKDLDERLVPNGEYRDAVNVQVSTSEGSDVGSVQNILGNKVGCSNPAFWSWNPIAPGSSCVGSISDEKNDTLYWLVAGPDSGSFQDIVNAVNSGTTTPIFGKDLIMRKKYTGDCEPVFVDKHTVIISNTESIVDNTIILDDEDWLENLTVGMSVTAFGYDNDNNIVSSSPAEVSSVGELTHIPIQYSPVLDFTAMYNGGPIGDVELMISGNGGCAGVNGGADNCTPGGKILVPTGNWNASFAVGDHIRVWDENGAVNDPLLASFTTGINDPLEGAEILEINDISVPPTNFNPPPNEQHKLYKEIVFDGDFNMASVAAAYPGWGAENGWPPGGSDNYFGYDPSVTVSGTGDFRADVFMEVPIHSNTNTINIGPSSFKWLDEIYTILITDGEKLEIQPSPTWPNGGCLDPNSYTNYVNDNTNYIFDVVECSSMTAEVVPVGNKHSMILKVLPSAGVPQQVVLKNTLDRSCPTCQDGYKQFLYFEAPNKALNFSPDRLITGINIIDDMLFWTDNFSEPKKINIPRSIEGTDPSGNIHTFLVNNSLDIGPSDWQIPVREEHLTVIRKSPKSPPVIDLVTGREGNLSYTGKMYVHPLEGSNEHSFISSSKGHITNFSKLDVGDTVQFFIETDIQDNHDFELAWRAKGGGKKGSTLVLEPIIGNTEMPAIPLQNFTIKGEITDWEQNHFKEDTSNPNYYTQGAPDGIINSSGLPFDPSLQSGTTSIATARVEIEITSIEGVPLEGDDGDDPISPQAYVVDLFDEEEKLFEFKFPRFSYRYKYEDGEYSTFAPFSQVAFKPGGFDYHPVKGYNIGMSNTVKSVLVKEFITDDIPHDVVAIDILYKEDISPNVYIVDTIKPDDEKNITSEGAVYNNWILNEYEITSDTIYAVLPSNQLLRPWDNVPKKALAQEVSGNRLIYGNYWQNFDMLVAGGADHYYPNFKTSLTSFDPAATNSVPSIKSLREYQLGVVFMDEYGRETPVLSNPTGTIKLAKEDGSSSNRLRVGFRGQNAPQNMKYFKFFIKETSGEYYNMAMDRYYDAEDGNIWLAFPSTDRNKIDEDTFIILKKGAGGNDVVKDEAKYKVLAIKNEAPDFIKTKKLLIIDVKHTNDGGSSDVFSIDGTAYSGLPLQSTSTVKLNYAAFENTSARRLHEIKDGILYFELEKGNDVSERYRINSIDIEAGDAEDDPPNCFNITIDGRFGSDVNKFTNDPTGVGSNEIKDTVNVRIWKYVVENSPQFDGRFFVKIYNDSPFKANIKTEEAEDNTKYRVVASKKIYMMKSSGQDVQNHDLIFNGWENNNESGHPGLAREVAHSGYCANCGAWGYYYHPVIQQNVYQGELYWKDYVSATIRMGQTPHPEKRGNTKDFLTYGEGSRWMPFDAFFRGINMKPAYAGGISLTEPYHPHGIDDRVASLHPIDNAEDQAFEDVWFVDNCVSKGTFSFGNPDEGDQGWKDSVHTQFSGNEGQFSGVQLFDDKWSINLGFGGVQPKDKNNNKNKKGGDWSIQRSDKKKNNDYDFFSLEEANDRYVGNEAIFIQNLRPGAKFRWKEDPTETIYEISGNINNYYRVRFEDVHGGQHRSDGNNEWGEQSWNYQTRALDRDSGKMAPGAGGGNERIDDVLGGNLVGTSDIEHPYICTSTFFRPSNFTRNWRITTDKPLAWNPFGQFGQGEISNGKEVTLTTSANAANSINRVTVDSLFASDGTSVEVGMVLVSGASAGTLDNPAVLVHIQNNLSNHTLFFKRYDTSSVDLDAGSTVDIADIGTSENIVFKQYKMNGISPNSAKNINFFNEGKGVNDTNAGVAAVGYTLEIVEPIFDDEVLPKNPAVWETEPKESTDLDIYYEASGYNALHLDDSTIRTVIPIDSLVIDKLGILDQNTYVTSVYNNNIILSTSFNPTDIPFNTILNITRPDGTILGCAVLESIVNPNNPNETNEIKIRPQLYNSWHWLNWHNCYSFGNGVESNRIRDNFNQPFIANGVKASTTLAEQYGEEHRKYGLIYSGIYNKSAVINNLNQFIQAEKITKDINPAYGSIQKLHSRSTADGDLIALCEDRILRILANKDAVYNADGNTNLTATNRVLGQTIPFAGEYGISRNPESFASEAYRAYFTDKVRGAVMRLSKDGLTAISEHGMKDWFRDNLKLCNKITGSYDDKKDEYNVTLHKVDPKTVSFKENVRGWVSFKTFIPDESLSCANEYYTIKNGNLWLHHVESVERNKFYNFSNNSSITVLLNDSPSTVKSFNTLNYEGSQARIQQSTKIKQEELSGYQRYGTSTLEFTDGEYYNLNGKNGWYVEYIKTDQQDGTLNEFIEKEGKWFNYIRGKDISTSDAGVPTGGFDISSFAIQGIGSLASSAIISVAGCTDPIMFNYDPNANIDDGSCIVTILGCVQDPSILIQANNVNPNANTDDGSCIYLGCTDPAAFNYEPDANQDNGTCIALSYGCTDGTTFVGSDSETYNVNLNYSASYNTDCTDPDTQNSCVECQPTVLGCTYLGDDCYNSLANTNYIDPYFTPGGCCGIMGCTDTLACDYDASKTTDCNGDIINDIGYNPSPGWNSCCTYCGDASADNYDNGICADTNQCLYCGGILPSTAQNGFSILSTTHNSAVLEWPHNNWSAQSAQTVSYDIEVTDLDDDSNWIVIANININENSTDVIEWSTNIQYELRNLPPDHEIQVQVSPVCANSTSYMNDFIEIDFTTLTVPVTGCTDSGACNYDPTADTDDGSCDFTSCAGCQDDNYVEYCPTCTISDSSQCLTLIVNGCTDESAYNYDPTATVDDSSCLPYVYGCMDNYTPWGDGVGAGANNYNNLDADGNTGVDGFDVNTPCNDTNNGTYAFDSGAGAGNSECCTYNDPTISFDSTSAVDGDIVLTIDASQCPVNAFTTGVWVSPVTDHNGTIITNSEIGAGMGGTYPTLGSWWALGAYITSPGVLSIPMMTALQIQNYQHTSGTANPFLTFLLHGFDIKHPFTQQSLGGGFTAYTTSYQLNVTAGCTDSGACDYNSGANYSWYYTSSYSCDYSCLGCTTSGKVNYDPTKTIDDGSCFDCQEFDSGEISSSAWGYGNNYIDPDKDELHFYIRDFTDPKANIANGEQFQTMSLANQDLMFWPNGPGDPSDGYYTNRYTEAGGVGCGINLQSTMSPVHPNTGLQTRGQVLVFAQVRWRESSSDNWNSWEPIHFGSDGTGSVTTASGLNFGESGVGAHGVEPFGQVINTDWDMADNTTLPTYTSSGTTIYPVSPKAVTADVYGNGGYCGYAGGGDGGLLLRLDSTFNSGSANPGRLQVGMQFQIRIKNICSHTLDTDVTEQWSTSAWPIAHTITIDGSHIPSYN